MLILLETTVNYLENKYLIDTDRLPSDIKDIATIENGYFNVITPDPRERTSHRILAIGETIFEILQQKHICESNEWICSISISFSRLQIYSISNKQDVEDIEAINRLNRENDKFVIELYRKIGKNYYLIYSQHNCKK